MLKVLAKALIASSLFVASNQVIAQAKHIGISKIIQTIDQVRKKSRQIPFTAKLKLEFQDPVKEDHK